MVPTLNVYTTLNGNDILVGVCRFSLRRGRVGTTFSYDPTYLGNPLAFPIDPLLPLDAAPMHTEGLPGALRDSSPDRWGRHLIARRAIGQAEAAGSPLRTLDEVDTLSALTTPRARVRCASAFPHRMNGSQNPATCPRQSSLSGWCTPQTKSAKASRAKSRSRCYSMPDPARSAAHAPRRR